MPAPARVVLADPPWAHDDALGKKGAAAKYKNVMPLDQIARYALPPMAADCLLLMWRVASMQEEALFVCRAWGFTPKSEIVWDKLTVNGLPFFGMGRYVRAAHETCIVATRGRVRVADKAVRSRFQATVGEHSAKPDEIHRIAERLVPGGPYVELFARRRRRGWRCIGNELQSTKRGRAVDPRQLSLLGAAE